MPTTITKLAAKIQHLEAMLGTVEINATLAQLKTDPAKTMALAGMIRNNDITLGRAEEIAAMVMRTNANNLYQLGLK